MRTFAAALGLTLLAAGCTLRNDSFDAPALTSGSEFGLPGARPSSTDITGAPSIAKGEGVGVQVRPGPGVAQQVRAYRVAGRRSPVDGTDRDVQLVARSDAAGLIQALNEEGHVLAQAVYVDSRQRGQSVVPVDFTSTAFSQLLLMPPFATSNPAEIVLLRVAAQQSVFLDRLASHFEARAKRDAAYLGDPDDRSAHLMAALVADVHRRMNDLVAALPRPASPARALTAGLLALGPATPTARRSSAAALDRCDSHAAQELVAVSAFGGNASTGVCFRPPIRSDGQSLEGEDELFTLNPGQVAVVGVNESPSWAVVTRAGSADPIGLIPAVSHTIPGPTKVLDAIKGAATAPLLKWQEVSKLYLTGQICGAMDVLGFALRLNPPEPDYCNASYRNDLEDEIAREVMRGFEQLTAMVDPDAAGRGGVVLDAADVRAGLLVSTGGTRPGGVRPDAFPAGGDLGTASTSLAGTAQLLAMWTQAVKPGYELVLALSAAQKGLDADRRPPSERRRVARVLVQALGESNAGQQVTAVANAILGQQPLDLLEATATLVASIRENSALRAALFDALGEEFEVDALEELGRLTGASERLTARIAALLKVGDVAAAGFTSAIGAYNLVSLLPRYARFGQYRILDVPGPAASPTPAPAQVQSQSQSQNVQPTCSQIQAITKRWTTADRKAFDEKTGGDYMFVGFPFTEGREFRAVYVGTSESGDAREESYRAGTGWRLVDGGGSLVHYFTKGNFMNRIFADRGTPIRCEARE